MSLISELCPFVDPRSGALLKESHNTLVNSETGDAVATIEKGIPRFVSAAENYAESFGWQWKTWSDARSDSRNPGHNLRQVILERTHFESFDLDGATLLECGMGGGDDTEILLQMPFREVHAFDISTSVERAKKYLDDPRLTISQASIYAIPYPDRSFDVVYCHRVLQHTPDPTAALRAICRKVKPNGILFAHSYKRSWLHMNEWRYKYRWITKRLRPETVYRYVLDVGPTLHELVNRIYDTHVLRALAYCFIPFYCIRERDYPHLNDEQRLEMAQHITFDALTPWHDHPVRPSAFRAVLEEEGFDIIHWHEHRASPMYCTSVYAPVA
jgi:ubiquinone/menaquinone biosynthesis C-methylase UbiE